MHQAERAALYEGFGRFLLKIILEDKRKHVPLASAVFKFLQGEVRTAAEVGAVLRGLGMASTSASASLSVARRSESVVAASVVGPLPPYPPL